MKFFAFLLFLMPSLSAQSLTNTPFQVFRNYDSRFVNVTGDTMTGQLTVISSATFQDSNFSVGGSTLVVINGKVGIGTSVIPVGGIGKANIAIHGGLEENYLQITNTVDDYPIVQIVPYGHDNSEISFDAYWDGTAWKSSDAGSNFIFGKYQDRFRIRYSAGNSVGNSLSWETAFNVDNSGNIGINNVNPQKQLDIIGDVQISTASTSSVSMSFGGAVETLPSSGYSEGTFIYQKSDHTVYVATETVVGTYSWKPIW